MKYQNSVYPFIGNLFYLITLKYIPSNRIKKLMIQYKCHHYFRYSFYILGNFIEYKLTYT